MKRLELIHLVQFSFFDADTFETRANLALLGPNAVGKTSILDAIQIAMLGAHRNYLAFNSQSVSSRQNRTLKDYCLGTMRSDMEGRTGPARKRDHAHTYVTLVFRDAKSGEPISAGVCLSATVQEPDHRLRGLYVAPNVELALMDHLQAVDGGTVPVDWDTFQVELLRRTEAGGRSAHVSVHPERYIDELLHAIQPSARHIDRHAFVRAFKKSMRLKDIESVNDFLRDYLVDTQPINKQTALEQIKRFKDLKNLIRETEEQIGRLGAMRKEYDALLVAHRRADSAGAVKAQLLIDLTRQHRDKLLTQQSEAENELRALEPELQRLAGEKTRLGQEIQALIRSESEDPEVVRSEQNRKLWVTLRKQIAGGKNQLSEWALSTRQTLGDLAESFSEVDTQVASASRKLQDRWDALATSGEAANARLLHETRKQLLRCQEPVREELRSARESETAADKSLRSFLGQARAAERGAKVGESVGIAIEFFRAHGIEAEPISALIEIKDRSWQAVFETFLGPHREALVVTPEREREAVALIRRAGTGAEWVYDVTVVQPKHLGKRRVPESGTAAALISGSNDVAVAYVQGIFGDMRCVSTEAELERFPRSVTRDGMMSRNGGTKRLRLPEGDQWKIGSKLSALQQRELHQQTVNAQRALEHARATRRRLEAVDEGLRQMLRDLDVARYSAVAETVRSAAAELANTTDPETVVEPQHVQEIRAKKSTASAELTQIDGRYTELTEKRGRLQGLIEELAKEISQATETVTAHERDYESAKLAVDFDADEAAKLYREICEANEPDKRVAACDDFRLRAETRIKNLLGKVGPEFQRFLDQYNVSLIDELSDWRKAKGWVEQRLETLESSELVNYKHQAEEALTAAEEAFRRDIAYRLREAMQRLEYGIKQLNSVLGTCPAFSGNERYRFVAKPAEAHKTIYDFIQNVDQMDGVSGSLFSGTADVRTEVIALLEASAVAEGRRTDNPLEDYRLFYNFDVVILQNDEEVDLLSKRIGVASNGEHRVPFYVIAGASLAAAYRLNAGKVNDGAAVMLLDEAFYGIDSQNSFATAQFLKSLGLQLIMAGPEADQGKLAPMTDTLYELVRYGGDVFYEQQHFSENMHRLMTSDMPMINEQLLDNVEHDVREGRT